ncbi:MAG: Mov34/MPN/PAD-1 family protein [Myxococcales bacterium]
MGIEFAPDLLATIVQDSEKAYPHEACGLVFGRDGAATAVFPMQNVYDRYHRLDPSRFPRDSRTAYKMDELKVMNLVDDAARRGERLVCIYHSHNDVGAYFSAEDKAVALADGGEPLWPGTSYLVVSVRNGRADGAVLFDWNGSDFAGAAQPLPGVDASRG